MISPKKAADLVLEETGYEQLINVKDYDRKHFVVTALPEEDTLPPVGTTTTFGVDKITGAIVSFFVNSDTVGSYQKAKIVYTEQ